MNEETTSPGWSALAALLVLPLATGLLAMIALQHLPIRQSGVIALAMTLQEIAAFLLYALFAQGRGWPSLRQRFAPVSRQAMAVALGAALAVKAIPAALVALVMELGADFPDPPDDPLLASNLIGLLALLPAAALLGPAWEELLFRGLLLDRLRRHLPVWAAVLLSALLISLVHDNHFSLALTGLLFFLERFVIGVVAALLVLRYRSLVPAFLFHAANNALTEVAAALIPS